MDTTNKLPGCRRRLLAAGIAAFIAANIGSLWVWSQAGTPTPNAVAGGGSHRNFRTVAVGKEIFAIGGLVHKSQSLLDRVQGIDAVRPTDLVWAYSVSSGQWRACAPLPEMRDDGALAADGGSIYYFGGTTNNNAHAGTVMRYELAIDRWEVLPDTMPLLWYPRAGLADGLFCVWGRPVVQQDPAKDGELEVWCWLGGTDTGVKLATRAGSSWLKLRLDGLDQFDPYAVSMITRNNELWVTGCKINAGDSMWVEKYDLPDLDRYAADPGARLPRGFKNLALSPKQAWVLPQGRDSHDLLWLNNRLYLLGGLELHPRSNLVNMLPGVDVIDPDTPGWRSASSLPSFPDMHTPGSNSPVVVDGHIYLLDGNAVTEYIP